MVDSFNSAPTGVSDSLLGGNTAIGETVEKLQETTELKKWKAMQYIKHVFIFISELAKFCIRIKIVMKLLTGRID